MQMPCVNPFARQPVLCSGHRIERVDREDIVSNISHLSVPRDMFSPTDLRPLTRPGQACVSRKKGVRQSRGMGPVPRDQETISDHG